MHLATLISQITEPMVIFFLLSVIGAVQSGISGSGLYWFVGYTLTLFVGIWFVRTRLTKSLHTNWDASDRHKRIPLLLVLLGFCLLVFGFLQFWHNAALTRMNSVYFFWLLGFFLMTLKTKISGHLAVFTLALGYCVLWFGAIALPGLIAIPLVAWSRLVLKRHTMVEVVGGFLYSFIVLILISYAG